ncbi:hypothetical protein GH754_02805 [Salinibacillus xinjiangensis]|uniref:histidine kinase n=2 Tax=Salinibacillus xinjiangensis TaxID=1229268 RepID=A0A6G1X2X7_9BACI|nr:hypothetical protein [Salinibacillus xinjiangensis]
MLCITFWQIDIAILYIVSPNLNEGITLFLFKLFRLGPMVALPLLLYICFEVYKSSVPKTNRFLDKVAKLILNKKMIFLSFISAAIVYGINWTNYGIKDLRLLNNSHLHLDYYFPVYGILNWTFIIHLVAFLILLVALIFVGNSLDHGKMKSFLKTLVISSLILFLFGWTNFVPSYQILVSSIAVLIYSIFILLSFIKMYNDFNTEYLNVVQRQNKLDYIGNLTASLIHEVKNSLSIIKGYSEIIPSIQKLEPQTEKIMGQVITSSNQLSKLVNAYNQFLKNDIEMEFESKNVVNSIKMAAQMMDNMLKEQQVHIEITPENKGVNAYINNTYFTQVFINLIKNAIEATPSDRLERVIKFNVIDFDNTKVIIDMYDCGCGISRDKWDKVFLPYNSSKSEGTGLGLPFCSKVMFSHRGFIDIVSSNSDGTHFRLQIPKNKFVEIDKVS